MMSSALIVADIFGKTPALEQLAKQCGHVDIIDPYQGQFMNFDSEKQAYDFFSENVGIDAYYHKLHLTLNASKHVNRLIGFSVGAAVIWRLSSQSNDHAINKALCFYGSQIRHDTDVVPTFNVHLVLPAYESHFSVDSLANNFTKLPQVSFEKAPYLHGFMNEYSNNFARAGYLEYCDVINKFLKIHTDSPEQA